ncbi:hypothetical protein D3C87_89650 [compost metagenome]
MKKIFSLLCLLVLVISACSHFSSSPGRNLASTESYVDPRYQDFQVLVAQAFDFRVKALQFAQEKNLDKTSDVVLTRTEGNWLREMGEKYLAIRKNLYDIALSDQAEYFERETNIKITPYKGTRIYTAELPNAAGGDFVRVKMVEIDPTDRAGQEEIFKIQMSMAATLILLDNYLVAIQPYQNNKTINYLLNYDIKERRALQALADNYNSTRYRQMTTKAVKFVEDVMAWRRSENYPTSNEESHLYGLSQSSIWYLMARNDNGWSNISDAFSNLWSRITLRGTRGVRAVTFGVSMGFGNMVGLVQSRQGYLLDLPAKEKEQIASELQPLDILFEKTPFRLTDKMIPGHYGHVAIWIGTEEQIKALGIWGKIPKQIQERISSGHHIVEALRPGVQINTLEHFLNIDDMLVLRDRRTLSDDYRRTAILTAVAQIGREYDFNFDAFTHHRIVCSEIAYVVFPDVEWPLDKTLGRQTISPDNVVKLSVNRDPILEPVLLYYDGKRYKKDLTHSVGLLLQADDASYAEFKKLQGIKD